MTDHGNNSVQHDLAQTSEELRQINEQIGQTAAEFRQWADHVTVDLFCEATEQAAHYLNEAAKGLAEAAYMVAYAAEIVGWLGSALHWLAHILPGVGLVADFVDKVGSVSQEKALKADFQAIGIMGISMEIASLGWDARTAGHVADSAYPRVYALAHEVQNIGHTVVAVLFD
jgi:hypothetical protein